MMKTRTLMLTLLAAATLLSACGKKKTPEEKLLERAKKIHDSVLTIDTHIDWPSRQYRDPGFDPGVKHETGRFSSGQWDLIRMQEGGLDAVFMSIFIPQGSRNIFAYEKAQIRAKELIQLTKKMVADHPDLAEMAYTAADAVRIEKAGKRAIFMGMENGYSLGDSLKNVQMFYDLGVRYITLTHSRNNDLGDSSTDDKVEWRGLSPFGEQVVREMNRLGVMVDISHVSDETLRDVLALTQAPVIASHSAARALCDHPRNLSDDLLRAIRDNGGVVQVCLLADYIKKMPPDSAKEAARNALRQQFQKNWQGEATDAEKKEFEMAYAAFRKKFPGPTVQDAVDHIDHMVEVMGVDHVGIGSDFDGGGGLAGIWDVSEMPNLTVELVRRGYAEEDIRKIWGGNLLRVMRRVEDVARELQAEATSD